MGPFWPPRGSPKRHLGSIFSPKSPVGDKSLEATMHSKKGVRKRRQNDPQRFQKEAILEVFWATLPLKRHPETERPETHQTLACVCQNDIRGVPRDPSSLQKTPRDAFFPQGLKKPPKRAPKTSKMSPRRAPKGSQGDQKGLLKVKKGFQNGSKSVKNRSGSWQAF